MIKNELTVMPAFCRILISVQYRPDMKCHSIIHMHPSDIFRP